MNDYALYKIAMDVCHSCGIPWYNPVTGQKYPPPKKSKRKSRRVKRGVRAKRS